MDNFDPLVGKTILRVVEADNRMTFGDDAGWTMFFTDGSSLEVSASMGQGCGYLIEDFKRSKEQ